MKQFNLKIQNKNASEKISLLYHHPHTRENQISRSSHMPLLQNICALFVSLPANKKGIKCTNTLRILGTFTMREYPSWNPVTFSIQLGYLSPPYANNCVL